MEQHRINNRILDNTRHENTAVSITINALGTRVKVCIIIKFRYTKPEDIFYASVFNDV